MAISPDNDQLPPMPRMPDRPYYNIVSSNGAGHFLPQDDWTVNWYPKDGLAYIVCKHKKKDVELVFFSPILFEKVTPDAE